MKKGFVVSIVFNLVLIFVLFAIFILFLSGNLSRYYAYYKGEHPSTTVIQYKEFEFTRTYTVVSNLNESDSTGNYNYYVVDQYNKNDPTVVKIPIDYSLEENKNYEIKFKGSNIIEEDTLYNVFNNFEIISITPTDKEGNNQIQDRITLINFC